MALAWSRGRRQRPLKLPSGTQEGVLLGFTAMSFVGVGVLVAVRARHNAVGWLILGIGGSMVLSLASIEYIALSLPGAQWADGPGLDPDAQQIWRIWDLEPATDAVAGILVETDRAVAELDFDPTGNHLLYTQRHSHPPREQQTPAPTALFHWHAGTSTEVTEGLTHVAW